MSVKPSIEADGDDVLLRVRVQPRSSRDAIVHGTDGRVRVALTAAPVDGEANAALRELVAKTLGVPRRTVTLVHGEQSREKTLRVAGCVVSKVECAFASACEGK